MKLLAHWMELNQTFNKFSLFMLKLILYISTFQLRQFNNVSMRDR